MGYPLLLSIVVFAVSCLADSPKVFAHVVVGNWQDFNVNLWKFHIIAAQNVGIDGFVLNTAPDTQDHNNAYSGRIKDQLEYAFTAAQELGSVFKLFIAFDYKGSGPAFTWQQDAIKAALKFHVNHPAYFKYKGRPYVSTFEGTDHINDWWGIKDSVPGGIFFVPDWSDLGPQGLKQYLNVIDGAFSWEMWPKTASDMTSEPDRQYKEVLAGKHYMMGISPWFYTKLPGYGKKWVWRGDDLWHTRWDQIAQIKPDMVQIVTWNDYGESHYIGPIYDAGVPHQPNANAHPYVDGMPHDHWTDLLPYYIARFKNPSVTPPITKEKLQYWYRLTPASVGQTDGVTGGNGPVVDPSLIVQDKVFFTALVKEPAAISVQIGDHPPTTFRATSIGANHFSQPFNNQFGPVKFRIIRNNQNVVSGIGESIRSSPGGDGAINYNAWVGGAST